MYSAIEPPTFAEEAAAVEFLSALASSNQASDKNGSVRYDLQNDMIVFSRSCYEIAKYVFA